MITAYVTHKESESTFTNLILGGVVVDSSGALYLISERAESGEIKEGHIIASGSWTAVEIQNELVD